MLAFHHQLSIAKQRYDDDRAGMSDVFPYRYFAIRHARVVEADVQKVPIVNIQAVDGRFGEVEGRFGHRFGHNAKSILKMQTSYRRNQRPRIILYPAVGRGGVGGFWGCKGNYTLASGNRTADSDSLMFCDAGLNDLIRNQPRCRKPCAETATLAL